MVDHLPEQEEGLLYADVDLTDIVHAKSALDPSGHYCRPDATRLLHNTQPRQPVSTFEVTDWKAHSPSGVEQDQSA
ncbi:aliphatic nitrilase [Sphingobium sp. YG1]|nr:aliphatic nitrilase [Sphingobium sp. YG1]